MEQELPCLRPEFGRSQRCLHLEPGVGVVQLVAQRLLQLAHAVSDAAAKPRAVEFIDMPASLRGQYQSFTQAPMERLRAAGYAGQFTPLEEGIRQYVQNHLAKADCFV